MITFEDFKKLDLRVGKILSAERVQDSDKLVRLMVDLGDKDETGSFLARQIVAGIGVSYSPEELLGKEIIVVANLEPRKLMGIESQGMLLATRDGERVVLLGPEQLVSPGSPIS